jgi:quercetin dioxygenase-like cupin family protein
MKIAKARRKLVLLPVAIIALGLVAFGVLAVAMQPAKADHGGGHGVVSEIVAGPSTFPDDVQAQFRVRWKDTNRTRVVNVHDPDRTVVVKLTFDEGGSLDWHTHPGPVIAVVAQGSFRVTNAVNCLATDYEAGNAFIEIGGNVHKGENIAEGETVIYATVLGVPDNLGPTQFLHLADAPEC